MKLDVNIDDDMSWPPGSVMRFYAEGIDLLGIVISNAKSNITVWWPRGTERIKTYNLRAAKFNPIAISRFL